MKKTEQKTVVGVRMPVDLKKKLVEIGVKNERNLTQQILFSLKAWIAEAEKLSR